MTTKTASQNNIIVQSEAIYWSTGENQLIDCSIWSQARWNSLLKIHVKLKLET